MTFELLKITEKIKNFITILSIYHCQGAFVLKWELEIGEAVNLAKDDI